MSSVDRFLELAPLAALDALDGQDLLDFREHMPGCTECQAELAAYEKVAGRMGASVGAVPPPPAVRDRVLASIGARIGTARAPRPARWWLAALATASSPPARSSGGCEIGPQRWSGRWSKRGTRFRSCGMSWSRRARCATWWPAPSLG